MKNRTKQIVQLALVGAFGMFVALSFVADYGLGKDVARTFGATLVEMLKLLPCAFILIALFDVWVKRETVERHFGKGSGIRGYLWGILLAGMSVGGMYVAFPVACSLFRKGAKLSVIFAYVGFAGVCRIPMTMFEASFMGGLFTAVRLGVSIPLVAIGAVVMGRVLERRGYQISE
ncbi:MAG: permease [Phycisphaerae bacterium]|nr:permease [Phycisphaerae bacterium]